MKKTEALHPVWIKAAVLGSLWAASEIVLGSFLHNLKIPFRSNILTAIAIMLLIAVSQRWKDKGLYWRSGLVCALMKSISPSAIIFGPMMAIFMEGLLMEIAIRIFKHNLFGFMIAGALAMSWNLLQFLLNQLIFYGYQIFDLYKSSIQYIEKQIHLYTVSPSQVLAIILVFYFLAGMLAATFGYYIGKKAKKTHLPQSLTVDEVLKIKKEKVFYFPYSLTWLTANIVIIVGLLLIMNLLSWKIWMPAGIIVLSLWFVRYSNNFKRLLRPFFLVSMVLLLAFSTLIYFLSNPQLSSLNNGLYAGLEMIARAIILILGFSVLGTELRNPTLMDIFKNSFFKKAVYSIEIAFDTLPSVLSAMPSLKTFVRKPGMAIFEMVSYIEYWFDKAVFKNIGKKNILFITGVEKSGKSSFLEKALWEIKKKGYHPSGIISPAIFIENQHSGYDLTDIISNKRIPLSRINPNGENVRVGNYFFYKESLQQGKSWLELTYISGTDFVIIDEIGPWELKGNGWASSLNQIVKGYPNPVILVVRESIIDKVKDLWGFQNVCLLNVQKESENIEKILDFLAINVQKGDSD